MTDTAHPPSPAKISLPTAFVRGLGGHCPHCGEGKIFSSFLKVAPACSVCGEEFLHHRADDMPAYIVILVSGHIIVPLAAIVEINYGLPYWLDALIWVPACLALCLGLLQPVKGAVIAIQWFHGMHGFAAAKLKRLQRPAEYP